LSHPVSVFGDAHGLRLTLLTLNCCDFYTWLTQTGDSIADQYLEANMKTERRHELQQNELAAYLNKANTYIEPYSKQILAAVIVLFAIGIGYAFYSSEQEAGNSSATFALLQQTNVAEVDPESLKAQVISKYPDTAAGELAKLYEGLALIQIGTRDLYEQPEIATESLNQGISVLTEFTASSDKKLLKSRGQLGVAIANESLGELDAAITAYKQVVAIAESDAMVEHAEARIATLERPSSTDFVTWFKGQDFSQSPLPPASLPNTEPSIAPLDDLPVVAPAESNFPELTPDSDSDAAPRDLEGGLKLPTDTDATKNGNETPDTTKSDATDTGATTPAPGTESPAVSEPPAAAEEASTETPSVSEPEAPAAEAPAAEAPAAEAPAAEAPAAEAPAAEAPAADK